MSVKKVGGIRFVRIGRLQLSFCVCRARPADRATIAESSTDHFISLVAVLAFALALAA